MSGPGDPRERGVALLTVLLLVAAMSILAMGLLDDMRFGLRRATNTRLTGQAQWNALGAESLARVQIDRLSRRSPGRTSLEGGWNGRWFDFPTDEGRIRARVRDGAACFNLNSVVEGAPEHWVRRDEGVEQFRALLRALNAPATDVARLPEVVADWIDSDASATQSGAEDSTYARRARPLRTSGALLAEVSELRPMEGMTPELYARVRPFVCALPTADLSPLNLNTLSVDQAPLLTMLTLGRLAPEAARAVIWARPDSGWVNAYGFWGLPALAGASPSDGALAQASVRTRYFALDAEVIHAGAEVVMSSLFELSADGRPRLVARRWTRDE